MYDLVVRGGTIITASDTFQADIGITGETIAAIGPALVSKKVIDASGKLVIPGGVDPHVHLEMPVGETKSSDDWLTGTIAAACGGTTTVIDFVEPQPGESLLHALEVRRQLAETKTTVDFALHMTLTTDDPAVLQQIPTLCAIGCTSFKTYLTYPTYMLSDGALINVLEAVKQARGIVMIHAENQAIINHLRMRFRGEFRREPKYHALSRPPVAEAEAINRALALAEIADTPIYIVHISTAEGAELVQAARRRNPKIIGETCPQYLLLTDTELSRPDFEGAKFVCSPPLRSKADQKVLWKMLADDGLQSIGTDHCPFYFVGQKDLGKDNYERIPGGLPGIESRLALLYTYGVRRGKITANRWVEICCTNPARAFGLYPRKGTLVPGSDADLVLFDPDKSFALTRSKLHEHVDYTPYEGFELQGYPALTMLRGKVISDDGQFTGYRAQGKYLAR